MKSTNKITLLVLSCLFIFISCFEGKKAPKVPKAKLITIETAKSYYKNYSEKYKIISDSMGKKDSRLYWYSYEELEGLIHYFKEESKKKGIKSDGIMFYLGAYPKTNENERSVNRTIDKSGYTNLVLVPSQNINGSHVDVPLEYYGNDAELSPPPYHNFGNGGTNNPSLINGGN